MASPTPSERDHGISDNPLVQTSRVRSEWVKEAVDYVGDEDLGEVLDMAVRMMSGDVPEPAKIAHVCTRLEAYAVKFRMQFVAYMSFKKGTTDANMKKNHYKELYTGIDRLVDSLKYVAR